MGINHKLRPFSERYFIKGITEAWTMFFREIRKGLNTLNLPQYNKHTLETCELPYHSPDWLAILSSSDNSKAFRDIDPGELKNVFFWHCAHTRDL